jgi:hypothetical protein
LQREKNTLPFYSDTISFGRFGPEYGTTRAIAIIVAWQARIACFEAGIFTRWNYSICR